MRQVANSAHAGGAGFSTQQINYSPTEDSWLWCSAYLADVLKDLGRWTREYDGVVDYDVGEDASDSAIVFWREGQELVYPIPRTGAQLTYRNSLSVLYIYYAWVSVKAGTTLKPELEFVESGPPSVWHCWTTLSIGTLSLDVHSGGCSTRWLARHTVVFKACRLLHQGGVLDDMLLPDLEWNELTLSEGQGQDHGQDKDQDKDQDQDQNFPGLLVTSEESSPVRSKKRLREEDADLSERVDSARTLNCSRSLAIEVGNSLVKLAISLEVFTEFPAAQEHDLTEKRSQELQFKTTCGFSKRAAMVEVGNEFLRIGIEGGLTTANLQFSGLKHFER
ncbi:hypothetical protein BGZ98_004440, partial [Dissophora globulifera]